MLIKDGDGSKSYYFQHIGGYFTFVGFALLSLIFWGLNYHCWLKKRCCLKEYHNPTNISIYWWISFICLCGIFACCISGIITSHSFGNKLGSARCLYERIYYDSQYGEFKESSQKWIGLKNIETLTSNLTRFINTPHKKLDFDFKDDEEKERWAPGDEELCLNKSVYYRKDFQESIKNITEDWKDYRILKADDGRTIWIREKPCEHPESIFVEYINEATRISRPFTEQVIKINNYTESIKEKKTKNTYKREILDVENKFKYISANLNSYKTDFLDKVDYYLDVSNAIGYILVTIYYSILLAIVVGSCFLLWAYSYFKEQKLLYLFMHISWNILKFFSFSFFMLGATFGVLFLLSRDLIGFNQYLFSNANLNATATTKELPSNKDAREYLRFCVNEEDNNYINKIPFEFTKTIRSLYKNSNDEKDILNNYDYSKINQTIDSLPFTASNLRNIEVNAEIDHERSLDDVGTDIMQISVDFTKATNLLRDMINEIYDKLYPNKNKTSRNLDEEISIVEDIENLNKDVTKLDCQFIKYDLQILYDSFYEISIESRISCALSCFIGFLSEISVIFYLLVLYHYNNTEFNEGNESQKQISRNKKHRFDLDSQNEFMDKSRPINMKKNNKKLDLQFSDN